MASSGIFARSLARALDLPEAVATTTMKVLRMEDMVSKRGRGTSAAMMSAEDAATFLVAIASGAVPSQIVEMTNLLLDMQRVDTFSSGPMAGFEKMRASLSLFHRRPSSLRDALVGLLRETSGFVDEVADDRDSSPGFDPQFDSSSLRFILGTDARKTGGFAIVRARVAKNSVTTHYFSTWPHRAESTAKGDIDPFDCFECKAGFLCVASFDGTVFSTAIDALKEPITRTRQRFKRFARS